MLPINEESFPRGGFKPNQHAKPSKKQENVSSILPYFYVIYLPVLICLLIAIFCVCGESTEKETKEERSARERKNKSR